jgi:hypothetical protein
VPVLVDRRAVAAVEAEARALLGRAGTVGLPLAELLSRLLPAAASRLREFYLEALRRAGALQEVAGRAVAADLAPVDDPLAARIERLPRARFAAPSSGERPQLGAKDKVVEGLVRFLLDARLARVGGAVLHWPCSTTSPTRCGAAADTFDVGQFKDRFA